MEKKYKLIVNGKGLFTSKKEKKDIVSNYRYTKDNPYISNGASRETEAGKEYTGFKADVAEFNDKYMKNMHYGPNCHNKMGLGIDEVVSATINFSRKNYADYFPEEEFPKDVKMVGNTIKSKKMPEYIAKFLEKGIRLLLQNKGQEFLEAYYDYIDKIYNYNIPLKAIASKGKVKKSLDDYVADCQTTTKSGSKKSRQAWMELALKENLPVNLGETIYYINVGKKKSESDVKRITHFYGRDEMFGAEVDMIKTYEKEYKNSPKGKLMPKESRPTLAEYIRQYHPEAREEDEIILNCVLLPRDVVESDVDHFCKDGEEYNVPKYIEQFNKRITPLLVCFSKDIRDRILITDPSERPYFTAEESKLCSGQPNKEGDQDTFEQLMTMDDKEIRFWMRHPEWKIPFLKECGMDWEKIRGEYVDRKTREKQLGIDKIRETYENTLNSLSMEELDELEDGKLPSKLDKIIMIDPQTNNFVSKEYPDTVIGTIYDIFDAREYITNNLEEEAIQNA